MRSGNIDATILALNTHVQTTPNDTESYHLLSKVYFHLKMWDPSITYGEKAVKLAPNNSNYWMWLGRAYGEKAENSNFLTAFSLAKKVRTSFEKAVSIDGNNVAALTDLAEYYVDAPAIVGGGSDKAKQVAAKLATLNPGKSHWVYAILNEKDKNYTEAERELREAIRTSGNDGTYWLNLADLYRGQGRWDDMDAAIANGLNSNNRPIAVYYNAATIYLHAERNLPKATALLRKYISTADENDEAPLFQAHYMLGTIMEKQGDKAGAANEYRAALSLASNYAPAADALKRLASQS